MTDREDFESQEFQLIDSMLGDCTDQEIQLLQETLATIRQLREAELARPTHLQIIAQILNDFRNWEISQNHHSLEA